LLRALGPERCAAYVPVDLSREHLEGGAARLRGELPWVTVVPVCADFTSELHLGAAGGGDERTTTVVYFPGSTIGNFDPPDAERLLASFRRVAGPGGSVVIGFDLKKDPAVLHAAYNDTAGVTAAFNRNLLVRLNRELGADFEPSAFVHHAFYDPGRGRIEMHLVAARAHAVRVAGREFRFAEGESVRTERSYKYDLPGAARIAAGAGLELGSAWLDDARQFAVMLFRPFRV
jgi:dimethylhistidine N-methyltransferase